MWDMIAEYLVLSWSRRFERKREWIGVVEKKKEFAGYFSGSYPCQVTFRTEQGRKRTLRMAAEDFEKYHFGQRYHKSPGNYLPDPKPGPSI